MTLRIFRVIYLELFSNFIEVGGFSYTWGISSVQYGIHTATTQENKTSWQEK